MILLLINLYLKPHPLHAQVLMAATPTFQQRGDHVNLMPIASILTHHNSYSVMQNTQRICKTYTKWITFARHLHVLIAILVGVVKTVNLLAGRQLQCARPRLRREKHSSAVDPVSVVKIIGQLTARPVSRIITLYV